MGAPRSKALGSVLGARARCANDLAARRINKNMLKFKEFFLERVYQLSNVEQESVIDVVDRYMDMFDPKKTGMSVFKIMSVGPEKVYAKHINEKGFVNIGIVSFHDDRSNEDKQIPVYVSFDKNSEDKGTYVYNTDKEGNKVDEYILLYYYKLKYNLDVVEDILVHELFHAKQPYKSVGKHYQRSKIDYYTDPVEVHAYVSNIVKAIENEYLERDSEGQSAILKFLEAFVREGKLPNLPESSLIKNIGKDEFVDYLYNNRDNPKFKTEYRRFINKLNWLLQNLKQYTNR